MEFHRKAGEISASTPQNQQIRVVGIGSAGANILRRIEQDGGDSELLIAVDTDARSLQQSAAGTRLQLGADLLKGIATGGDPELGREAAQASEDLIREALDGVDLLFLCTGLGGGTASGAAPEVARIAKDLGCFVLVFVTLPFHFEGRRRVEQAKSALESLRPHAGALLTFENDKLGELIVPKDGVEKAFEVVDMTICHSVRAITTMLEKPGMIRVGMKELLAVLNGQDARCLFGFGKATGAKRAEVAVAAALENPLLHDGDLLSQAKTVMVHISGNRSVTLSEVEAVMARISEGLDPATEVLFGVSASDELGDELWVAVISSIDRGERRPTIDHPSSQPAQESPQPVKPVRQVKLAPAAPAAPAAAPAGKVQKVKPVPQAPPPNKGDGQAGAVVPQKITAPVPDREPRAARSQDPVAQAASPGHPEVEDPPLVPLGPPKPKLKAPLPPPSPAPVLAKPAMAPLPEPRTLVSPQHLMATPEVGAEADTAFQVASPAASPEAGEPIPTGELSKKVHIDYRSGSSETEDGSGAATITLEQPEPSVASKAVPGKPKSPLTPRLAAPEVASPAPAPAPRPAEEKIVEMPPAQSSAGPGPKPMAVPGATAPAPAVPREPQAPASAPLPRSAGRFDQVEPTVIDGQDMDVPTFLRSKRQG